MERDEAALTGLALKSFNDYPVAGFQKEAGGNAARLAALRLKKMLTDAGITKGSLALYGQNGPGWWMVAFSPHCKRKCLSLPLIGFPQDELLMQAMMTKEEDEIERIRKMGRITTEVVAETADYLSSRKVKKGHPL